MRCMNLKKSFLIYVLSSKYSTVFYRRENSYQRAKWILKSLLYNSVPANSCPKIKPEEKKTPLAKRQRIFIQNGKAWEAFWKRSQYCVAYASFSKTIVVHVYFYEYLFIYRIEFNSLYWLWNIGCGGARIASKIVNVHLPLCSIFACERKFTILAL